MDHPDEPRYSELGTDGSRPPGSSWGVFGADDEVGTLKRVTTDAIVRAASLVTSGQVFSLNWEIDKPSPPVFGRRSPIHHVEGNSMSNEDYYDDFFLQASTQWDSLSHIRHLELGYYNGIDRQETPIAGGHRLGIQNWAERGIVGRFVLLDVARHRAATRAPLDYGVRTAIGPDELDAVMRAQGVTFQTGELA